MDHVVGIFLLRARVALVEFDPWTAEKIEDRLRGFAAGFGIAIKPALYVIRMVVTGSEVGLPLFESMELLGKEKTLERIEKAFKIQEAHRE